MRIPLFFRVLWRNDIVESEDKEEDVECALSDRSFEMFVGDTWGLTDGDDNDSFDDNDDDCFSKTDKVGGSSKVDEDGDSFNIDDDSSKDQLEDEGWS